MSISDLEAGIESSIYLILSNLFLILLRVIVLDEMAQAVLPLLSSAAAALPSHYPLLISPPGPYPCRLPLP